MVIKPKGITKAGLLDTNIGEDYWSSDFSNYEGPKEAGAECLDYLIKLEKNKGSGIGLLLAGKVGTGKTTLLAIVLKYLARANWKVYMTSLSELVELIKRSWDDKDTNIRDLITHCRCVDFLGLDDLGKEHQGPTGFSQVTFDNLLRYRAQHRLPTLFTTNLNRMEIKSRYGDAVLSLIEGKTRVVSVQGQDFRSSVQKNELIQNNS